MRGRWLLIALVAALVVAGAFAFGAVMYLLASAGEGGSILGSKIGVVEIKGSIVSADDAVKDMDEMRRDGGIKAVIVRIESPGGSVGASQEILEAVRLLDKEKPVVASMGNVAASGGYYAALGARRILASPGTITGSIGVRMEHVMIGDLLRLARIGHETLKSGRFKDIGAVDRPITPEEREIIQGILAELHEQFKAAVVEGRKIDAAKVDELADGRVYSGSEALKLNLIDRLGGFAEAISEAKQLAGIDGEVDLIYPKKRGGFMKRLVENAAEELSGMTGSAVDYWRPVIGI